MRFDEAALYFGCSSRSMTICTEGVFRISIYCYDAAWSGHLEFEIGIVRDCIEASERGSSAW